MPSEITVNLNSAINWVDLLSLAITSAVTIIALFVGARISRSASIKDHNRKFLAQSFAEVLAGYSLWIDTRDRRETARFFAAAEKARLLCSPETEFLLKELENKIASHYSAENCAGTESRLRKAMRAELESFENDKKRLYHNKRHPNRAKDQQHRPTD